MSSATNSSGLGPAFDPFSQSFTLLLQDGSPFNVTIPDLDSFMLYNVRVCINYGSQLGASLVLLVMLLLLTKPDKRVSPIFVLNALSLSLNFIRSLLQCLYFTCAFNEPYAYFADDYSRVPRTDYATSIAADVLTLLLLVCVEVSLVLQTRIVCTTLREIHRHIITAASGSVALLAIGFRFGLVVENCKSIMSAADFGLWAWLASATNITTTISICFFCTVFTVKLGFALHERKKLAMKQFAPMRIIFIMGCQTLVVPAIFAILQYFIPSPEFSTDVVTLVAISLPLSSLWAAAALDGRTPPSSPSLPNAGHSKRKLVGSYATGSTEARSEHKGPDSPAAAAATAAASPPPAPRRFASVLSDPDRSASADEDYDVEAQTGAVRVERSFTVESQGH